MAFGFLQAPRYTERIRKRYSLLNFQKRFRQLRWFLYEYFLLTVCYSAIIAHRRCESTCTHEKMPDVQTLSKRRICMCGTVIVSRVDATREKRRQTKQYMEGRRTHEGCLIGSQCLLLTRRVVLYCKPREQSLTS